MNLYIDPEGNKLCRVPLVQRWIRRRHFRLRICDSLVRSPSTCCLGHLRSPGGNHRRDIQCIANRICSLRRSGISICQCATARFSFEPTHSRGDAAIGRRLRRHSGRREQSFDRRLLAAWRLRRIEPRFFDHHFGTMGSARRAGEKSAGDFCSVNKTVS